MIYHSPPTSQSKTSASGLNLDPQSSTRSATSSATAIILMDRRMASSRFLLARHLPHTPALTLSPLHLPVGQLHHSLHGLRQALVMEVSYLMSFICICDDYCFS